MTNPFAIEFRERFTRAYERSDYTSHRGLSLETGWSESRVNQIITGFFDHSEAGPGFFGTARACKLLGITPDYLAGIEKWQDHRPAATINALSLVNSVSTEMDRPTVAGMIRRYVRSGQRIEGFTDVLGHCDIYENPHTTKGRAVVRSVGDKSLSALRMGVASVETLQTAYDEAADDFRRRIHEGHRRAFDAGILVEPDAIDERMTNKPVHVKIDYIRAAMRLTDADGKECLLVYCEIIPQ